MSSDTFIQDPERHFEHLPQPFAFIQELILSLLDSAYERLLETERDRAKLSNLTKLSYKPINSASISEDASFADIARVKLHLEEEDGVEYEHLLIIATRVHLLYFPVSCAYLTQDPLFQFKLPVEYPIQDVHVLSSSNRFSLIRCYNMNKRIEFHIATARDSYRACSIPDDEYTVVSVVQNDYQIVVTCSEGEDLFILLFSSPIPQWRITAQNIFNASDEDLETNSAKLINFAKPVLLGRIKKPDPIHPSTFFYQSDLHQFYDTKNYMNGIAHTLTEEFFKNQANNFNARRPGFTSTLITPTSIGVPLYAPHTHSVVSESVGKKDLIVWWEGGTDLFVYSTFAPTKELNIYPLKIMNLAADFCSSCVTTTGDVVVLGYERCLSVWKFPARDLIKFQTVDQSVTFSLIKYLPNSRCTQFVCVTGSVNYLLTIKQFKETLSILEQPSDPVLPDVTAVDQLIMSSINHYILLQLTDGVRVLRDIAADTPGVLALLQPPGAHNTYICTYLNAKDRQLYSIIKDSQSGARSLVQYDLSPVITKSIIPEFEDESKPIPESAHSPKRGFTIPADYTVKTNTFKLLASTYGRRDEIKKKAKEIMENFEQYFPPES